MGFRPGEVREGTGSQLAPSRGLLLIDIGMPRHLNTTTTTTTTITSKHPSKQKDLYCVGEIEYIVMPLGSGSCNAGSLGATPFWQGDPFHDAVRYMNATQNSSGLEELNDLAVDEKRYSCPREKGEDIIFGESTSKPQCLYLQYTPIYT